MSLKITTSHIDPYAKNAEIKVVKSITNCARCDGTHKSVIFFKLYKPLDEYTYWAPCPVNEQPILMKYK